MPKPRAPEPDKAEPYRADNRPVGSPTWAEELRDFIALVHTAASSGA